MIYQQVSEQILHLCNQMGLAFKIKHWHKKSITFAVNSKEPNHWFGTETTIIGNSIDQINQRVLNYFTHAHELFIKQ